MNAPIHASVLHRHTPDSPCLRAVDEVTPSGLPLPDPLPKDFKKPGMIRQPGWFVCREKGHSIHDHGGKFHAHEPQDRCKFGAIG